MIPSGIPADAGCVPANTHIHIPRADATDRKALVNRTDSPNESPPLYLSTRLDPAFLLLPMFMDGSVRDL